MNKGNCLYNADDYDRAKEFFLEAIGVEADCIEAIYNLGLVYKRLNYYNESLQAFEKRRKKGKREKQPRRLHFTSITQVPNPHNLH